MIAIHSSDEMYGADRMLLQVLAGWADLGARIEVWLPDDLPHPDFPLCRRLDELGYRWRHMSLPVLRRARLRPGGVPGLVRDWFRTLRALRAERPEAVYLGSSACLLAAPAARVAGVPVRILHLQERWVGRSATVLRMLARWTTARVAISDYVARTAALPTPEAVVVPNCVDDAAARVAGGVHDIDRDDERELVFVVASRWNRWKGHRTLLEAWDRAGCPGRLVVLAGPPPTGDGVDVHALVADLVGRPATVEIVGEVPDIAPFVAAADVLVLPSDQPEPFGLVVLEAFSLGRPVIASRAGGPADIVDEGRTGWLFDPQNVSALASLLAGLEPATVADAGQRAREAYERSYRPDRYRNEIRRVLAAQLSQTSGHDRRRIGRRRHPRPGDRGASS